MKSNKLDNWHSSFNDEILSDLYEYGEYFSSTRTGCAGPILKKQNKHEKIPDYSSIYYALSTMTAHIRMILKGNKDLKHLYKRKGFKERYDQLIDALDNYKNN